MADWLILPDPTSKSPPLPVKGTPLDTDKAYPSPRSRADRLSPEPTKPQARTPLSNNAPLVANRPELPLPLHTADKRTAPTPASAKAKQRVTLILKKPKPKDASGTKVTYYDNLDGLHQLLWDKMNSQFEAVIELECGEHSGCIVFGENGSSADIQTFQVPCLANGTQSITISIVKLEKPSVSRGNKATTNEENKGAVKREEEELQRMKELRRREEGELLRIREIRNREEETQRKSREKLEMEIKSLKLILEEDKKRVVSERQVTEYKREIEKLKEQLDKEKREKDKAVDELAGHRNGEKLRELKRQADQFQIGSGIDGELMQTILNQVSAKTSSDKGTPVRSADYVNLETGAQRSECYVEFKELEKSIENLSKAKQESEFNSRKIIDFLHREKNQLMDKLTTAKRELEESKYQIEELKERIRDSADVPPLPTRRPQVVPISPRYTPHPALLSPGHFADPSRHKF